MVASGIAQDATVILQLGRRARVAKIPGGEGVEEAGACEEGARLGERRVNEASRVEDAVGRSGIHRWRERDRHIGMPFFHVRPHVGRPVRVLVRHPVVRLEHYLVSLCLHNEGVAGHIREGAVGKDTAPWLDCRSAVLIDERVPQLEVRRPRRLGKVSEVGGGVAGADVRVRKEVEASN